jgi:hypothetical protein
MVRLVRGFLMGLVSTDITLRNGGDITRYGDGRLKKREIRAVSLPALVDTGPVNLSSSHAPLTV